MILVTKRRQIGTLCGHAIYCIDESQLITVPHSTVQTEASHSKVELRFSSSLSPIVTKLRLTCVFWQSILKVFAVAGTRSCWGEWI
jgi:hypothetical protein